MRGQALLRFDIARLLLLVTLAQRFLVDAHRHFQLGCVDFQVFQGHPLGIDVAIAVILEIGFDLGVFDLTHHIGAGHGQDKVVEAAQLVAQGKIAPDVVLGHEARSRDLRRNCLCREFAPHPVLEHARRHVLSREQAAIGTEIELAVLLEGLDLADLLLHAGRGDDRAETLAVLAQQFFVDHPIEHAALVLGALELAAVELLAHHLLHLAPEFLEALPERIWRNLRVADLCDIGGALLGEIVLHPEKSERDDEQGQNRAGNPAGGLFAQLLQHGRTV